MKIQIFHHNGQLAEFPLDTVTGLQVVGDDPTEQLTGPAAALNADLHALIDKPGVPAQETVTVTSTPLKTKTKKAA